jgi:hypothetical protein
MCLIKANVIARTMIMARIRIQKAERITRLTRSKNWCEFNETREDLQSVNAFLLNLD